MLKNPNAAEHYAASYLDERIQGLRDKFDIDTKPTINEQHQKSINNISNKLNIEEQDYRNKEKVLEQAKIQGLNVPSKTQLNESPKLEFEAINTQNQNQMMNLKEHILLAGEEINIKVGNKVKIEPKKA